MWTPFVATVASSGLTTASTNYSTGDQLGAEMTLAAVAGVNNGFGVITGVTLIDDGDVMGASELWIFSDATTEATDNTAAAWSDADAALIVPGAPIFIPAPIDVGGARVAAVSNLWVPFQSGAGHDDLFCDLVTRSNNAFFVAVDDLHLNVSVLKFT